MFSPDLKNAVSRKMRLKFYLSFLENFDLQSAMPAPYNWPSKLK